MALDQLILGGVVFDNFSTPSSMMGGGRQAMVIHKLPGGSRVIDTLGPDDADITWDGQFFSDDAYDKALLLDGMRAAGDVIELTWGGQFRQVIISNFIYRVRRLPVWVSYEITCVVYQNPQLGILIPSISTFDTLVSIDLSSAIDAVNAFAGQIVPTGTPLIQ